MNDQLLSLLKNECDFVWENVDSFESTLCHSYELTSLYFNDECVLINMVDTKSGQHFSTTYKINEYFSWKNSILDVNYYK